MSSSAPLSKKLKLSNEIDYLSLHPELIHKLKQAKLCSFKAILHLSHPEIQKTAKVSASDAQIVLETVSEALLANKIVSAYDILHDKNVIRNKLSSELLKNSSENCNSIYTGTITEICGESGCGKTQLCLYLSICAQIPAHAGGLNSKVVYIHTEGEFPIKRFLQMANAFKKDFPELQRLRLSDNLVLKKVFNLNQLMYVLQNGLPDLLKKVSPPRIIIIDSVAALLRCEYDSWSERTSLMVQLATEIWKLANIHQMAVLCVNQVSGSNRNQNQITKPTNLDVPSLGLLWSNILTTRIKISRKSSETNLPANRILELIFSSYHPHICNNFMITECGIQVL
ncbi:DNA repair protein XRCC3 [Araneus ventricosus]|uniref:DNA repair protein XRCC3 n=1 Tax=Araneus ventricosus TaxID=182803 RepID=A0A4Y2DVA6_ARAVE|nr:DNA repair protein XRCC3 [Araneus ventricosus]